MSISGSLSSALSGLTTAGRAAEIASSNIANATTEGYGRRVLQTSARVAGSGGQGVQVVGVLRIVNSQLIGDRRVAQAGGADKSVRSAFYRNLEATLGTPDQPQSLNGRISAFDASLLEATSHPESAARLSRTLDTARSLVGQIATASRSIQSARSDADAQIGAQVDQLNTALARLAEINTQVRTNSGSGRDSTGLMDQRQQIVDSIAKIIPIREVERENGQVALYAVGGAVILEGTPAVFGFTKAGVITPEMTRASGALSGLTLNGRAIETSGDNSPIRGGSLAGSFAIRDDLAVDAQTKLDAVARDLVERFQDPALDATRAPGSPGLFTDGGQAFDPANEVGLAQRLRLNTAVDPDAGGQLWRLRDGLGATSPGPSGNARLLSDLQIALNAQRSPASGGFMAGAHSFSTLSADFVSTVSSSRLDAEGDASYAESRADTLKSLELQDGVDTDQEMQQLLQIEQAYAANAKVVKTVDEMIQTLLGM